MQKTLSFGVMHVSVAFLVVWTMTGDWRIGGAAALVEPVVNTVAFYFHERIWNRIDVAHRPASWSAPRRWHARVTV